MAKVLFVDGYGHNVVKHMKNIPRTGDIIPLFDYNPAPKVTKVVWFPEEQYPEFKELGIDVAITVS